MVWQPYYMRTLKTCYLPLEGRQWTKDFFEKLREAIYHGINQMVQQMQCVKWQSTWTKTTANHVSLFFSLASLSYFSNVLLSTCPVRNLLTQKLNYKTQMWNKWAFGYNVGLCHSNICK